MSYSLVIADRMYSSWSLRGWLMFEKFGLKPDVRLARMATPEFADTLAEFGATLLVPAMRAGDLVVWDSLAMAETLAERHPDLGFWPEDAAVRGIARSIVAEMHSGFTGLRGACAMNLWQGYGGYHPDDVVRADLDRIEELWACAREARTADDPWLFGTYCLADVFYAPVAARIAGYGLPVGKAASAYVAQHLADPAFRRWRAMGIAEGRVMERYKRDLPALPWPGPAPIPAKPADGLSINTVCPYSGKPVASDSVAEIAGVRIGFCNPFCRDKTVADPEAWPEAMRLVEVAALTTP